MARDLSDFMAPAMAQVEILDDADRAPALFCSHADDDALARQSIAELYAASYGAEDVTIRPTGAGACTLRALKRVADRATTTTLAAPAGAMNDTRSGLYHGNSSSAVVARYVSGGVVERTAHEMTASTFCLCPAGDTCVTSRLYTAIAAGCLPVVLCDQLTGAFPNVVPYASFWLKYPTKRFISNPASLLEILRQLAANSTEITRRRAALAAHRADVLYDEPLSRVGTRFLEAVTARCGVTRASVGGSRRVNETECLRRAGLAVAG